MFHVLHFKELPSTSDYVKEHAQALQARDVIWAYKQTKGRGRFDRVWQSEQDVTFSILFHKAPLSHTILAPLAVAYALSSLELEVQIKWPNDILYQGKKCGGILVERIYEGNQVLFDVAGIGINISGVFSSDLQDKAIALPITCDAEDILYRVLRMYEIILRMDEDSLLREYRRYNYLIGRTICLQGKQYQVIDVNKAGELIVQTDEEKRILRSEEITLEQIYQDGE